MKLRYISAVATLAVLLPFAASALTADDLQQQIQSLLAQIAQLQEQLTQIQKPNPVTITPVPPPSTCPIFNRTLAQGATGDDVTQLQQYLGVSPTGYFGTATARAVTAVQADAGLSQIGIVGPATRAWIYKRCGGGGWNQNFSASPTSGQAPLAVHFWATVSGGEYKVDFGDGTSGGLSGGWCPPNPAMGAPCSAPGADHTYTSAGTYTARLLQRSTCAIDTTCWVPVLGASTVTITVVTGSWTDNCLSVYGCSYPVPPSQYPNATVVVGQTSSGSTPVAGTGGSCVYNGQTYPNDAVMSSAGTSCTNPMGCGISSTYLVCQDGRSVVTLSPPTTSTSAWR